MQLELLSAKLVIKHYVEADKPIYYHALDFGVMKADVELKNQKKLES